MLDEVDPDVLQGFDVCGRDLRFLIDRCSALKLGPLCLGRTAAATGLRVQASTNYSKNWVRSQSRMSALSNQTCWRVKDLRGRVVMDVLRSLLVTHKLTRYSIEEAVSVLLPGRVKEAVRQAHVDRLLARGDVGSNTRAGVAAVDHAATAADLVVAMACLTEAFELSRVTGLAVNQVAVALQALPLDLTALRVRIAKCFPSVCACGVHVAVAVCAPGCVHVC